MQFFSSAFKDQGDIPLIYTCEGKNINPPLTISGVPANCQSLVLIMEDPDVPKYLRSDGMWDHWILFNIPPSTQQIEENSLPAGSVGKNTEGKTCYDGPCPPDKEHRYFFKLYALNQLLDLDPGATKKEVEKAMEGHILAKAELVGRYEKKKKGLFSE